MPDNPTQPGTGDTNLQMRYKDTVSDEIGDPSAPANFAIVRLYPSTDRNVAVCRVIAELATGQDVIPSAPTAMTGCIYQGGAYLAYSRIG